MTKTNFYKRIIKSVSFIGLFCIPLIFLCSTAVMAQNNTVRGTVTDANTGNTLPGVNILVVGTSTGTATDAKGHYSLTVPSLQDTLRFSFIGYKTQKVPINGKTTINIALNPTVFGGKQLVVVGYGKQKSKQVTGSISQILTKDLKQRSASTVSQLLIGTAPGLDFSVNGEKGFQPGASVNVKIRGIGSINGGSPYVLVDGFPGNLDNLDPNNIKSISVLKDAAASAIYGAKAAFGVILVTTKSGGRNEKIHVHYGGQVILKTHPPIPSKLNSYIWAKVLNEAGHNAGGMPISHETIDRILAYQHKDWDFLRQSMKYWPKGATHFGAYPNSPEQWNHANLNYANNDWWHLLFGHSVHQKHNLSISGGTKNTSYYVSGGYMNDGSVLNYGVNNYNRVNLLGKLNFKINNWWDFKFETRSSQVNRKLSNMTNNNSPYGIFQKFIQYGYPIAPLYGGWGYYALASHVPNVKQPGLNLTGQFNQSDILKTQLSPVKGWNINASVSYRRISLTNQDNHFGVRLHIPENPDETVLLQKSLPSRVIRKGSDELRWSTNIFSSYKWNIKRRHNFYIMGGMQLTRGRINLLNGKRTDLITKKVPSIQTTIGQTTIEGNLAHRATEGFFTRFRYNYKNTYFFESDNRYDGSYVFRKGHRWGFFPSFSAGWRIDKEPFWNSIRGVFSTLKLRGSWGRLGNQNVTPYTDIALIPLHSNELGWIFKYGNNRPVGYTTAPPLVNRELTWEVATTADVGLDMSFLNERLKASLDLYQRTTSNMVGASPALPGVLGAAVPESNNATLRTRGWELSFNWKQNLGKVSYFVGLNASNLKSVITKYYNPTGSLTTWYKGKVVGEIWGYSAHDLFRSQKELNNYLKEEDMSFISTVWNTGDIKYLDVNHDGKVNNGNNTVHNHGDLSVIGNNRPHYQFGISFGASYKGFNFSMLWNGTAKRDMYIGQNGDLYWGFDGQWWRDNLTKAHLDYYRDQSGTKYYGLYEGKKNINKDAYWPRPYGDRKDNSRNRLANTRYLANLAFIRLKNVQIGYTLPASLTKKLHIQNLKIYLSGQNLLTFDHLPKGLDPVAIFGERSKGVQNVAGNVSYGATRNVALGISLDF